jgi:hypothetical protein
MRFFPEPLADSELEVEVIPWNSPRRKQPNGVEDRILFPQDCRSERSDDGTAVGDTSWIEGGKSSKPFLYVMERIDDGGRTRVHGHLQFSSKDGIALHYQVLAGRSCGWATLGRLPVGATSGGIDNQGTVTATNAGVRNNTATTGLGGDIYTTAVTVNANTATNGGEIFNIGTLIAPNGDVYNNAPNNIAPQTELRVKKVRPLGGPS